MYIVTKRHRTALVLTTSIFALAMSMGDSNSERIRADGATTVIGYGPEYKDLADGSESVISFGNNSLLKLEPTNGRISAGSALIESGGLIAHGTDFVGGERTGATVIVRHQNTPGNGFIELYDSTITTLQSTKETRGLEARHSHIATMTGGNITSRLAAGIDQVGALTWSGNSKVTNVNTLATILLNNVNINISDTEKTTAGTGVRSVEGGQITVQNGSNIVVGHGSNSGNVGVHSTGTAPAHRADLAGTSSLVTLINSHVTVHGDNSTGAHLEGSGNLTSNQTTFTVTGDNSIGVSAEAGSLADIQGGVILTTGDGSVGVHLDSDAFFKLQSSEINALETAVFFTDNNATDSTAHFTAQDSAISGESTSFSADAADVDIILTNVTASGSSLLTVENSGSVLLSTDNTTLTGKVLVDDGSNATVNMSGNSSLTGAVKNANILIDQSSTWNVTDNSTIKTLANMGKVAFTEPTNGFRTLSVANSFNSSGGLFTLYSKLGDDASLTDKLIFEADVSGINKLKIINYDGNGAQTITGIKVVEVHGMSDAIFNLEGDYDHEGEQAIAVGAYAYKLYEGQVDAPNDKNWYLRSQLKAVEPDMPDGPLEPSEPNGPLEPGKPLYNAGVPLYEVYPQLLLGMNGLPTLQQRTGNRYWNKAGNPVLSQGADALESYAPESEAGVFIEQNGVWGRIEGSHTKIKPIVSTSSSDYDYDIFKIQAGLDGMLHENASGKLIGGLTVHYTHGKVDVSSPHGSGEIKTDGYGFGGTLTWYGDNGLYVDNQAQLTWYDSDLHSSTAKKSLYDGNNGFGYALSMEAGKRFMIDNNWSVTPQAQLVYSNVRFDSFTDVFGARISKDKADSLQGRLGISADYQNAWLNDQGMINRSNIYGIVNLYNEFLDGTKVEVSRVSFTSKRDRLWAGIGLGGSYNWNDDKYSIFGEGSINTSLKNFGDSYNYKGTIGLRIKW